MRRLGASLPDASGGDAEPGPYRVGWRQRHVLGTLARLLSRYFRAEMEGLDRLPRDRPLIFVAKHPRAWLYAETIVLGARLYVDGGFVPFRVLEKQGTSLHAAPLVGWIRRHVGGIPATEQAALAALRRGESLLVFPGGARELHGAVDAIQWRGRRGYARVAAITGTPVVPFAIDGADRQHPWRLRLGARRTLWFPLFPLPVKLVYRFGEPMAPPASADPSSVAAFADSVAHATRLLIGRCAPAAAAAAPPLAPRAAVPRRARSALDDAMTERDGTPAPLDDTRWYYRLGYVPFGKALELYHRARLLGMPPRGPCIYVTHHGAGYLVLDLVMAGYTLGWKGWYERGEARTPLRIVAADSRVERALPGLPAAKRHVGIIGTAEADCLAVLEAGEQLLITPGGRREAAPSRDFYRLKWEGRYGFARLAMKTGASIVPLAVVGGAEAYPGFAVGKLSFWSPLPLPVPMQVVVGEPIPVERAPERAGDLAFVRPVQELAWRRTQALYDEVRARRSSR